MTSMLNEEESSKKLNRIAPLTYFRQIGLFQDTDEGVRGEFMQIAGNTSRYTRKVNMGRTR